jgi:hypothetical protein
MLPSATHMTPPSNTNLQVPNYFWHTAVPPAVLVSDADGEYLGTLLAVVAPEHPSPGTIVSNGAPVTISVQG